MGLGVERLMKRSKYGQTCHDSAVRKSAGMLRANGWIVNADVSGYKRPDTICVDNECRRPDIIANKRGKTRVIEWETPNSYQKDKAQHSVFRKYARRHRNTNSSVKICSNSGL